MKKKSEIAALEAECAAVVQPNLRSKRTASPAERSKTSKKGRLEEENLSDLSDLSDDEVNGSVRSGDTQTHVSHRAGL